MCRRVNQAPRSLEGGKGGGSSLQSHMRVVAAAEKRLPTASAHTRQLRPRNVMPGQHEEEPWLWSQLLSVPASWEDLLLQQPPHVGDEWEDLLLAMQEPDHGVG